MPLTATQAHLLMWFVMSGPGLFIMMTTWVDAHVRTPDGKLGVHPRDVRELEARGLIRHLGGNVTR
jgi:hypothetical protein